MDKTNLTEKRLIGLSENEWNVALEKCRRLINYRVQDRTKFGCHSEQHLGMMPFNYYVGEAIDKLYSGTWKWKEEYSFSEQMSRIIGSLISENVRKYKNEQEKNSESVKTKIPFENVAYLLGVDSHEEAQTEEREKVYENQLNIVIKAIDGNEDMEILLLYIMDGKSNDEICDETGWERRKLYKVADRMKTKVKDYLTKYSKEVAK